MNDIEKKIREKYIEMNDEAAPDMDALWSRIEEKLPEKNEETTPVTSKPRIKMNRIVSFAVPLAACIIAVIALPQLMNSADNSPSPIISDGNYAEDAQASPAAEENSDNQFNDAADNAQAEQAEQIDQAQPSGDAQDTYRSALEAYGSTVEYEMLSLNPSETVSVKPAGIRGSDNSKYFVEDEVLESTQLFCRASVKDVYFSDGGDTVCYTLEADETIYRGSETDTEKKTITAIATVTNGEMFKDKSEYLLCENRTYLLPLRMENSVTDTYRIVFPYAPQIEITLDNYYIFHNGWNTLTDGEISDVICTSQGNDDYYYDRMKLCSAEEVKKLLEYWENS